MEAPHSVRRRGVSPDRPAGRRREKYPRHQRSKEATNAGKRTGRFRAQDLGMGRDTATDRISSVSPLRGRGSPNGCSLARRAVVLMVPGSRNRAASTCSTGRAYLYMLRSRKRPLGRLLPRRMRRADSAFALKQMAEKLRRCVPWRDRF
jgi:hypothetical protein